MTVVERSEPISCAPMGVGLGTADNYISLDGLTFRAEQ
jgi:hypothetical protein